ncbi:signal recognition particle protein [bacterium]|nr:signal recognition particle protein [bacterium]
MFETLTDRIGKALTRLSTHSALTEQDVDEGLRELRLALLEADVNLNVVRDFVAHVKEKALGANILATITPLQMLTKIVYDELVEMLGGADFDPKFQIGTGQHVIMLVGLQGSGKTTTAGKIAMRLKSEGRRPLLVADDLTRPAAAEQLKVLGKQVDAQVFHDSAMDPVKLAAAGVAQGAKDGLTPVIVDTAGRLAIDEALMDELKQVKAAIKPNEILLVLDSMTGQDALSTAQRFDEALGITGLVLTKFDGDARGGAALSMRAVTGKPIRLVGTGEKLDALEYFHPERVAGRILGRGDVVSLVERVAETLDMDEAEKLEKKLRKQKNFDLEDFITALKQMRRMGSMRQLLNFIPGLRVTDEALEAGQNELKRFEAIVFSMTPEERHEPKLLNSSRRQRIAKGAGTSVQEINRFIEHFRQMQTMTSNLLRRTPGAAGMAQSHPTKAKAKARKKKR